VDRHPAIVVFHRANGVGGCIDEELNDIECDVFVAASAVEGRTPFIISSTGTLRKILPKTTNSSLADIGCDIFVEYKVEGRTPVIIVSSTGSGREIFQKTSNYSLVGLFISTCPKEEFIIADWIIGFQPCRSINPRKPTSESEGDRQNSDNSLHSASTDCCL